MNWVIVKRVAAMLAIVSSSAWATDSDTDGLADSYDIYPHDASRSIGLWREQFNHIHGRTISHLVNSPKFPHHPDVVERLDKFQGPTNLAERYGSRIHGVLYAPATGNYRFWIVGDDYAQLNLSTDAQAANKVEIASVPGWARPSEWNKYAEQKSVLIHLVAGQPYYIEALQKEGTGSDNIKVAWKRPDGQHREVINGDYFIPQVDTDGDGVFDDVDAFPLDSSESKDSDGDGVGDNADVFPNNPSETMDSDGDGVGDNRDIAPFDPNVAFGDKDNDGLADNLDVYPRDPARSDGIWREQYNLSLIHI